MLCRLRHSSRRNDSIPPPPLRQMHHRLVLPPLLPRSSYSALPRQPLVRSCLYLESGRSACATTLQVSFHHRVVFANRHQRRASAQARPVVLSSQALPQLRKAYASGSGGRCLRRHSPLAVTVSSRSARLSLLSTWSMTGGHRDCPRRLHLRRVVGLLEELPTQRLFMLSRRP